MCGSPAFGFCPAEGSSVFFVIVCCVHLWSWISCSPPCRTKKPYAYLQTTLSPVAKCKVMGGILADTAGGVLTIQLFVVVVSVLAVWV